MQRLSDFLDILPRLGRYAFEFRDASWFQEPVYEVLRKRGAAFCIYELDGRTSPKEITADFVYIRLHGPGGPYQGCYDSRALSGWAGACAAWAAGGREVYCYFDNDQQAYAARNAARLRDMLAA